MRTTRRSVLLTLAAIPVYLKFGGQLDAQETETLPKRLIGSWEVTSAVNSVILSIEAGGQALFVLMENGSFSIGRTKCRALPGGLLVDGLPRFRLWEAADSDRLRAEMEVSEGFEMSEGWRDFPRAFFMSRISDFKIPREMRNRALPSGWNKAAVDENWDQTAGKRRPKN